MKLFTEIKYRFSCIRTLKERLSNEKGLVATSTALLIGAGVAGAAGVGAAAIAGSGARSAAKTQAEAQQRALTAQERAAQEAKDRRDEAVRLKQEAAKNIKFPTFLEIPEAQEFKQTIQDRIAGRGLIDVDAQTAPVAQQVRAGLKQTQSGLASLASARGLGRSTVATAQGTQASQAAERDIASRVSQLEIKRQDQIARAVEQFGGISEREEISQQNLARFRQGAEFNIADTIASDAQTTKNDQFAIANTIQQNGATDAAFQLMNAEIWASALLGLGKSASQTTDDIIGAIEKQQDRNAATVNIGTEPSRTVKSARLLNPEIFA